MLNIKFILPKGYYVLLFTAILLGFALRLVWIDDMEYKGDELNIFQLSQQVNNGTEPLPMLGFPSSQALENPPLGSWTYIFLGYLSKATEATQLCLASRLLNCLGLMIFGLSAYLFRDAIERKIWIWAFALASVNPFAVLWQRKLWIQSLYPFYMPVFLLLWWNRRRNPIWAFVAGFWASLLCQIHLAGFFFFSAFLLFEFLANQARVKFLWRFWLCHILGVCFGFLLLIPWILHAMANYHASSTTLLWSEFIRFRFWRFFFTDPFGLRLTYSLGEKHFQEFLFSLGSIPYIANSMLSLLLLFAVGIFLKRIFALIYSMNWKRLFLGESEVELWTSAALWGYGIFISTISLHALVYRHYLLICYPLTFLFLANLMVKNLKRHNLFLGACFLLQLILTFTFLLFIHRTGGTTSPDADYGTVYWQQKKH